MQYYEEAEVVLELWQLTTHETDKVLLGLPAEYKAKTLMKSGSFLPYDNHFLS